MTEFTIQDFSLEGKAALITGVSYGIGFAITQAFHQAGARIVFNDRIQESLDRGLRAYQEANIDAHGYLCDVTDKQAVHQMIANIKNDLGTELDIIVNNAGIIRRIPNFG